MKKNIFEILVKMFDFVQLSEFVCKKQKVISTINFRRILGTSKK